MTDVELTNLANKICVEAHQIADAGGDLQQMVLDLLSKAGTARAPVERALQLCTERNGPGDDRAAQLLRRALATGLFEQ